jgi:hypothetical protein
MKCKNMPPLEKKQTNNSRLIGKGEMRDIALKSFIC